jgi:enamine deaminase RidA (YjgF/YER057c/UK114 family)
MFRISQIGVVMPENRYFQNPADAAPSVGYSHAVSAPGSRLIVTSGQVPLDESGRVVGAQSAYVQAQQVFTNLTAALHAAGAAAANVIKLTYYLTDMSDLSQVIAARDEWMDASRPPASTVVEVAALYDPRVRVEVEALATTTGS